MNFEDYQELAKHLKEAQKLIFKFKHVTPKKAKINTYFRRTTKGISQAKCWAEEMMYKEHPKQATTNIFYG